MNTSKIIAMAVLGAGIALAGGQAQAKDFRLGLITPPAHIWSQEAKAFADELAERSDGEHSVSVFPAQQLGNEAQMVQQLQAGSLDMAFLTVAEISNRVPDFGALYAPYLVENVDQAARLLRSDAALDLLDQLPAGAGLVGIGYGMAGMRQVLSRDPLTSAEDLRGQKLRITPFDPIRDFYTAVGAAPTPLPLPEVYDALANGQVDAIDMDFEAIEILKFYQQANHLLISNHMMFPMVGVVSGRVWQQLDGDDRELLRDTMRIHLDKILERARALETELEAKLRSHDIEIVEADADFFREAIDEWEATWSPKAPSLAALRQAAAELKSP